MLQGRAVVYTVANMEAEQSELNWSQAKYAWAAMYILLF